MKICIDFSLFPVPYTFPISFQLAVFRFDGSVGTGLTLTNSNYGKGIRISQKLLLSVDTPATDLIMQIVVSDSTEVLIIARDINDKELYRQVVPATNGVYHISCSGNAIKTVELKSFSMENTICQVCANI